MFLKGLPYRQIKPNFDLSGRMSSILLPFAFSFLLPVYAYALTYEKQEKLREMMKMNGLHMGYYWLINFLYNMVLYIIVALLVMLIGAAFRLNFFISTRFQQFNFFLLHLNSPLVLFLLFFGWGLNQVSMGFLLSTFFSKARTATSMQFLYIEYFLIILVVCYLLTLFSILSSFPVNNAGTRNFIENSKVTFSVARY